MRRKNSLFADDFNRADSASLGGFWETASGAHSISSNQAAGNPANSRYDVDLGSADHWCAVAIGADAVSTDMEAYVRMDDAGAHTCYGYVIERAAGGAKTDYLTEITEGTGANLSTGVTVTYSAGDVMVCEVIGPCIRGLKGTSLDTATERVRRTDTTISANTRAGIGCGGSAARLDNWQAGTFTRPAASPTGLDSLTESGSNTDDVSYATASVTPASGSKVYIAFNHERSGATPSSATSVTGSSISGATLVTSITYNTVATPRSRVELWEATGTGAAGAITISFGAEGQLGLTWAVIAIPNCTGVIQSATNRGNAGTTWSATLSAFASNYNGALCVTGIDASGAANPTDGWLELADQSISTPGGGLAISWTPWADTVPTHTSTGGTNRDWGCIGVELGSLPDAPAPMGSFIPIR